MKNLPERNRRRRKAREVPSEEIRVRAFYEWADANGVVHTTEADGLPPELRGPDGKPRLPAGHPVWDAIFEAFYQRLREKFTEHGTPLSHELYWLLWERERDQMMALYDRWLGGLKP